MSELEKKVSHRVDEYLKKNNLPGQNDPKTKELLKSIMLHDGYDNPE